MKKPILLACVFIAFLGSLDAFAQKIQRRVYVWDVTLSMKGYNGTPDIYQDVIKYIEKDIRSLQDPNIEIIVCPFQESVLTSWREYASEEGKDRLIDKIKTCDFNKVTNTNILGPLQFVESEYVDNGAYTMINLLTDGKQNAGASNDELFKYLERYERLEDVAFMRYVCLTKNSDYDEIEKATGSVPNIDVTDKWENMTYVELKLSTKCTCNLKDRQKIVYYIGASQNIELPEGVRVHVVSDDDEYVHIDEEIEVKNHSIEIPWEYDYEVLKSRLPEIYCVALEFDLLDDIRETPDGKIRFSICPNRALLELVNKPERVLKLRIKK